MEMLMLMMLLGGGRGLGGGGNNLLALMMAPNLAFPAMMLGKRVSMREVLMTKMGMGQIAMLNMISKPPPRRRRFRRNFRRRYRRY